MEPFLPDEIPVVEHIEGGPGRPDATVEYALEGKAGEYQILLKFIGALAHLEGRDISGPWRSGDPFPDFVKGRAGHDLFGIEITELVDQEEARLEHLRRQYARMVGQLLEPDVLQRLSGLQITLDDRYQTPGYPSHRSKAGKALAVEIADHIRKNVDRLERLPVWEVPHEPPPTLWLPETSTAGHSIGFWAISHQASGGPVVIGYQPGFPKDADLLQNSLLERVQSKGLKSNGGELWLLAYTRDGRLLEKSPSEAALRARDALRKVNDRPYAEIWTIFPYPGRDLGHIEQIWPPPKDEEPRSPRPPNPSGPKKRSLSLFPLP